MPDDSLFSFASWNVQNFFGEPERIDRCVESLRRADPDVFALFEVKGAQVYEALTRQMPEHSFFITEGEHWSDILVGLHRETDGFVTQRRQFKSGQPTLRPGALATLTLADDRRVSLLFLHLKSFDKPRAWGLRDDMIHHVRNLKNTLDDQADDERANFIALGDLNTMGLNVTHLDHDLDGPRELARYETLLAYNHLRLLPKTAPHTWHQPDDPHAPADLDHAFASTNLRFRPFTDDAPIQVRGWPQLDAPDERDQWTETHSDHVMLYGEVTGIED